MSAGRPRGGRRRPVLRYAGCALILLGATLLSYVAWEFWGTTWISAQHQRAVVSELRAHWRAEGTDAVRTRFGTATAIVEIPRFGHSYAVPVFEGTGEDILAAGYGHFLGTAGPGQVGNYVIAAHRVTHGEPLRNMPELVAGDEIDIVTKRTTFVYRLVTGGAALVVPMTTRWVTTPLPHNPAGGTEPPQHPGERLITLTTCAELFHTDNRMVAFGILERTRRTSNRAAGGTTRAATAEARSS